MQNYFDYFQLAGLVFFVAVFMGRTLYLRLAQGVRPITLGIGKIGWRAALEISFLFGLIIWLLEVLLYTLHAPFRVFPAPFDYLVLDSPLARGTGVCLVLAGFVLFIWALTSFGASWRVGIDKQSPGALVTTGVFAFSRNPIFVFVDLYFIGTFLLNGAVIFLMADVLVVVGLHVQILQEEQFLRAQYGQAYREYCARAPRYWRIGWLTDKTQRTQINADER
jgi:protein-S-isoprenylcysteine O-methyltransferase Ste14